MRFTKVLSSILWPGALKNPMVITEGIGKFLAISLTVKHKHNAHIYFKQLYLKYTY